MQYYKPGFGCVFVTYRIKLEKYQKRFHRSTKTDGGKHTEYTNKKCKHVCVCIHTHTHKRPNGSSQAPMTTNVLRNITDFLFLHDFKPIKSHGRIITYHNECLKHTLKNKYRHHKMVCSHEVLDVLDHSSYDNRVETRTKLHPVHNERSNPAPYVTRHMQSEQLHFQSTPPITMEQKHHVFFPIHFL
jgi:hypothetical protein